MGVTESQNKATNGNIHIDKYSQSTNLSGQALCEYENMNRITNLDSCNS